MPELAATRTVTEAMAILKHMQVQQADLVPIPRTGPEGPETDPRGLHARQGPPVPGGSQPTG